MSIQFCLGRGENLLFLGEWRLFLTVSYGKNNPRTPKMEQVNVEIVSPQTLGGPQQNQTKQHWAPSAVPVAWFFFPLRVLLTSFTIRVFMLWTSSGSFPEISGKHCPRYSYRVISDKGPGSQTEWGCRLHAPASALPASGLPLHGLEPASVCPPRMQLYRWPVGSRRWSWLCLAFPLVFPSYLVCYTSSFGGVIFFSLGHGKRCRSFFL